MTVPLALAGLWVVSLFAVGVIVVREILLPALRGPARLAPDPAFADRALEEDREVEALEAVFDLPSFDPRELA